MFGFLFGIDTDEPRKSPLDYRWLGVESQVKHFKKYNIPFETLGVKNPLYNAIGYLHMYLEFAKSLDQVASANNFSVSKGIGISFLSSIEYVYWNRGKEDALVMKVDTSPAKGFVDVTISTYDGEILAISEGSANVLQWRTETKRDLVRKAVSELFATAEEYENKTLG